MFEELARAIAHLPLEEAAEVYGDYSEFVGEYIRQDEDVRDTVEYADELFYGPAYNAYREGVVDTRMKEYDYED
jgi:hypothetical protein